MLWIINLPLPWSSYLSHRSSMKALPHQESSNDVKFEQSWQAKAAKDLRLALVGKGVKTRQPHTPFYRGGCGSVAVAIPRAQRLPAKEMKSPTAICANFAISQRLFARLSPNNQRRKILPTAICTKYAAQSEEEKSYNDQLLQH